MPDDTPEPQPRLSHRVRNRIEELQRQLVEPGLPEGAPRRVCDELVALSLSQIAISGVHAGVEGHLEVHEV